MVITVEEAAQMCDGPILDLPYPWNHILQFMTSPAFLDVDPHHPANDIVKYLSKILLGLKQRVLAAHYTTGSTNQQIIIQLSAVGCRLIRKVKTASTSG